MTHVHSRLLHTAIINPETGCWESQYAKHRTGYCHIKINRENVKVHRAAYEAWVGPIPDGLEIHHVCRTRHCIRPDHLEAVTHQVHMAGNHNALKTRCPEGHLYDMTTSKGSRWCTECRREYIRDYMRAYRKAKRDQHPKRRKSRG